MTWLHNDPAHFADEVLDGLCAAGAGWARRVPGGLVRATAPDEPTVTLVIGGGSGHYPAFGGLVGRGLAHGAVLGNIFASPAASQVESVARAANRGRGVLLAYGNYAGDVLQFDEAQRRLRADGIDCRTVTVTDDIFSAPPGERDERRGIAGDLAVFKVAGAAADAGHDLDGVERVARLANERTRSIGVAFTGCTLPGASRPLFEVPPGRMAVGMGIHGERGIDEADVPTAESLARLLTDYLMEEVPAGVDRAGARVVPILNGLGTVKWEELFVLYRSVHALLLANGIRPVTPQVGEFCTSFDMAGVSLTYLWLDEELERLWLAPADTLAFRIGVVDGPTTADVDAAVTPVEVSRPEPLLRQASRASREAARSLAAILAHVSQVVDQHVEHLGELDAVAGDGDHGIGMQRGAKAAAGSAATAVTGGAGFGTALTESADAWSARAGGTSGALWAVILRSIAAACGDAEPLEATRVADGVAAARDEVARIGGAKVGDKTLVDALVPFSERLSAGVAAGEGLAGAWLAASQAAHDAAQRTSELVPRLGRARSHGARAVGTPDPGAVSLALIARAVGDELARCGPVEGGRKVSSRESR